MKTVVRNDSKVIVEINENGSVSLAAAPVGVGVELVDWRRESGAESVREGVERIVPKSAILKP